MFLTKKKLTIGGCGFWSGFVGFGGCICFHLGKRCFGLEKGVTCHLFLFYLPLYYLTAKYPAFYKPTKFLLALFCCQSECSWLFCIILGHQLKFCGWLECNLYQQRREVHWVCFVPLQIISSFYILTEIHILIIKNKKSFLGIH